MPELVIEPADDMIEDIDELDSSDIETDEAVALSLPEFMVVDADGLSGVEELRLELIDVEVEEIELEDD